MRNAIRYFYNLYCDNVVKINDNYKITFDNSLYYLILFDGDINLIKNIYDFFNNNSLYCHEIILNKDNNIITNINNKLYIFIKIHTIIKKISYEDIINFNILVLKNQKCNWYKLWCDKIDYYEYQMSQFKKKYPLLYDSFSYYSGLAESAISLVSSIKDSNIDFYINHKRILKNSSSIDFYNPINMIYDTKVRDICEYFKIQYFYVENPIEKVKDFLNNIKLSKVESILFLARLLYPSYYFDLYDLIVQDKINENKINIILSKTIDYELFIKNIYGYMYKIYPLPEIDWLIKT